MRVIAFVCVVRFAEELAILYLIEEVGGASVRSCTLYGSTALHLNDCMNISWTWSSNRASLYSQYSRRTRNCEWFNSSSSARPTGGSRRRYCPAAAIAALDGPGPCVMPVPVPELALLGCSGSCCWSWLMLVLAVMSEGLKPRASTPVAPRKL